MEGKQLTESNNLKPRTRNDGASAMGASTGVVEVETKV